MNRSMARACAAAVGFVRKFAGESAARWRTTAAARGLPLALVVLAGAGCGGDNGTARHEVSIPWALGGKQLVADLHTHTRFSDGALEVDALVRKSYAAGCHALAITDHSDQSTRAGTQEYLNTLAALRQKFPQHTLIGGLEWNVPPQLGRIHMGILLDPLVEQHLITFKQRFENSRASVADAFAWLRKEVKEPTHAAFIYNHPSRHGEPAELVAAEWTRWRQASSQAIGFEGGPGHQNMKPNGAYASIPTDERWDPAVVRIGSAWDLLLDRGENPWAAIASSDYHKPETEYTPCEFSRTVLKVPEATPGGALKALHAGSFWASQGRFLDYLLFTANAPGLQIPASPGEIIGVVIGTPLKVRIAVERYAEAGAQPLMVEIIGNCKSGKPEQLAMLQLDPKQSDIETDIVAATAGTDGTSCYLRARVRGQTAKGEPALAYLNPIRVRFTAQKR